MVIIIINWFFKQHKMKCTRVHKLISVIRPCNIIEAFYVSCSSEIHYEIPKRDQRKSYILIANKIKGTAPQICGLCFSLNLKNPSVADQRIGTMINKENVLNVGHKNQNDYTYPA